MKQQMDAAQAWKVADMITKVLTSDNVTHAVAGSLRRGLPKVNDIDIIVGCEANYVFELLRDKLDGHAVAQRMRGKKNASIAVDNIQVDIWNVPVTSWGAMLLFTTGSKLFNIMMRSHAKKQGMLLNQYGLYHNSVQIAGRSEEQIFQALGLKWVAPEERNPSDWDSKRLVSE